MADLTKGIVREQIAEWQRWCDEIQQWYAKAARPDGSVAQMMEAERRRGWAEMAAKLRETLDEFEGEYLAVAPPPRPRLQLVVDNQKHSRTPGGGATPPDGGSAA